MPKYDQRLYQIGLAALALVPLASTSYATEAERPISPATESISERTCPANLAELATCYGGRDRNGAYFLIARPRLPNGILIVHAHGGPRHVNPAPEGSNEDLARYSTMVKEGYSWIGTTYRTGGYGVRLASKDVDVAREIYWKQFGRPRMTILHGQSYGGNVVAKLAESAALDENGQVQYDGVMLTGGAVGKRLETYDQLINLRVIYQYFCKNLPYPNEDEFPAWQGLPKQSTMPKTEARRRVNECTGVDQRPEARTDLQSRHLRALLGATKFSEREFVHRMELTTFRLQDVVHNFLGGKNPFTNAQTVYGGSGDDSGLNRGVERFSGDVQARDLISYDSDVRGTLVVPTISLQARYDPIVSYRAQTHYKKVVADAGQSHLLFQLLTSEDQHSGLSDSQYLATLATLVNWIGSKQKPTLAQVRGTCDKYASSNGKRCFFIENEAE